MGSLCSRCEEDTGQLPHLLGPVAVLGGLTNADYTTVENPTTQCGVLCTCAALPFHSNILFPQHPFSLHNSDHLIIVSVSTVCSLLLLFILSREPLLSC